MLASTWLYLNDGSGNNKPLIQKCYAVEGMVWLISFDLRVERAGFLSLNVSCSSPNPSRVSKMVVIGSKGSRILCSPNYSFKKKRHLLNHSPEIVAGKKVIAQIQYLLNLFEG